jgi:hypothetical protein
MGIIDDLRDAFESYIDDSVTITITDVAVVTGTSGALNVGEIVKCKIKVENDGHINMSNVRLHVQGENGATVSTAGAAGPFLEGLQIFGSLTVGADGGSQKSGYLHFKTPDIPKPAGTRLLKVHTFDWDGDWDDVIKNHAGHDASNEAIYTNEVFP